MAGIRFEWDERKNSSNKQKHGVSFEEAATVFADENALVNPRPGALAQRRPVHHSRTECGIADVGRLSLLSRGIRRHPDRVCTKTNEEGAAPIRTQVEPMKKEYDFSEARRNPYAKKLKRQVTIRLDLPTIEYFKAMAVETGIPYQTLINLYLRDCAATGKRLAFRWKPVLEGA
jgi:uncharacterized protein (DUF4415 family)